MRIMVLGGAGYLGWPTCMYLSAKGHDVMLYDNNVKWEWEDWVGGQPIEPRFETNERVRLWKEVSGKDIEPIYSSVIFSQRRMTKWYTKHELEEGREKYVTNLQRNIEEWKPDAIIHYAEQPSAPFSMASWQQCAMTAYDNLMGTINLLWSVKQAGSDAHIFKLGTMGEYGTPAVDIDEGWLEYVDKGGRQDRMLYPKKPGSFYHCSKVADSTYLEFACRVWGLRVTDLHQGIVYGMHTDETVMRTGLETSFHYDAVFGTALNRFIAQAVEGVPMTVYGSGTQTRGWLNIRDTLRCVELACLHPAERGEFRVMNQFTEQFAVLELAEMIHDLSGAEIAHYENPRVEQEHHYYNAKHTALEGLGLKPHKLNQDVLFAMMEYVHFHRVRMVPERLMPRIKW